MYRPFFGVHASIADKGPIFTLCDTKSTVHQTLFLFTIRLRSGTKKLRLPDLYPCYMTSILRNFCDVTYGRKTC